MKKILSLALSAVTLFCSMSFTANAYAFEKSEAPEVKLGETFEVVYDSVDETTEFCAKFTPTETAYYEFVFSNGVGDIDGEIVVTLVTYSMYERNCDFMNSYFNAPAKIAAKLAAGKTYYLLIQGEDCGEYKSNVTLRKHTHKMDEEVVIPATYHKDSKNSKYDDVADGSVQKLCSTCFNQITSQYSYSQGKTVIPVPKTITPAKTAYSYNGKGLIPTVTIKDRTGKVIDKSNYTIKYSNNVKVGRATATITFNGKRYSGTMKTNFNVLPKYTKITSLSRTKRGFTIKWEKRTVETSGYQIQWATDSKFKKNVGSTYVSKNYNTKTIKKLKGGKKYYVRVRTYKNVGNKKYYSIWTGVKSVKTKW